MNTQRLKLQLLSEVPTQSEDRRLDELRAAALFEIGRLHALRGRSHAGEVATARAIALYDALVTVDPSNTSWRASGVVARLELADQLSTQRQYDQARRVLRVVQPDVKQIAQVDTERTGRRIEVLGRWLLVSLACDPANASIGEAARAYASSVDRAISEGTDLDGDQRKIVAEVGLLLGDSAARNGHTDRAQSRWGAALRVLELLVKYDDAEAQVIAARLALRTNQTDLAARLRERLRNHALAHGRLRLLDQELRRKPRHLRQLPARHVHTANAFRS